MNKVIIKKRCMLCGQIHKLEVPEEAWDEYTMNLTDRNIQDIFPELSADERELIISGICGTCFDRTFHDS